MKVVSLTLLEWLVRPDPSHKRQSRGSVIHVAVTPATNRYTCSAMATSTVPGRILLVDDDPAIRESLAAALDPTRYVLVSAADGASALSVAEGFSPEVVLLDLGLPDVQGLDLIPRLRELDELAGIVVLTATSEISVVVRAMRLGADNFLAKPVSLETLNDVLGRTLSARRRDRQLRALVARAAGPDAPV